MNSADCVFCKIIKGQLPAAVVAETDAILVIKDIAPKAPIHYLIIPKKHIADIQALNKQDFVLGATMFEMAQKLSQENPAASDFNFLINSGPGSGQKVFHLHAHFIAGSKLFLNF